VWIAAAAIAGGLACFALVDRYVVLLPRGDVTVMPSRFRAFRIDDAKTMLVGEGVPDRSDWDAGVLIIHRDEQLVVRPSWYGRWLMGNLIWHRGSYAGVPLQSGAKLERTHDYRFKERSVDIDWCAEDGHTEHIQVTWDR